MPPLPEAFFRRPTPTVARDLVGCLLHRRVAGLVLKGRIVETEAYTQEDPASHSFRGPTPRCAVMFGPPGVSYVYRSYGIHSCLNVVTEEEGRGCAVLVRAVEPVEGLEFMWRSRYPDFPRPPWGADADGWWQGEGIHQAGSQVRRRVLALTSGPGRLTQAFAIFHDADSGRSMVDPASPLVLYPDPDPHGDPGPIVAGRRVGITAGVETPWRFCRAASPFLSRPPSPGRGNTGARKDEGDPQADRP